MNAVVVTLLVYRQIIQMLLKIGIMRKIFIDLTRVCRQYFGD